MKKLLAAVTAFLLLFSCATFASADETEGVFVPTYQAFMNAFVQKIEIINADYADAIREECFVDGKWVEPSSSYGDIYYYYLATDLRIREGNGFLNYLYIDLPKDHIGKEEDVFKQFILAAATSIIPDADEEFKQTFFESIYYDYAKESPAGYISMYWNCGVYCFGFSKSSSGLQLSISLSVTEHE